MTAPLGRRLACEGIATALLLAAIVGSGIAGDRLSDGNVAVALLANSLATAGVLIALIFVFGPVSGAHLNPAVSLAAAFQGALRHRDVVPYIAVQVAGALGGVIVAHLMFELPAWQMAATVRSGPAQWLSEGIATFGLVLVALGCGARAPGATPFAVGFYILGAYWFTASTSFANPAVTIARAFTDTFAGISPSGVAPFVAGQLAGAGLALVFHRRFIAPDGEAAA